LTKKQSVVGLVVPSGAMRTSVDKNPPTQNTGNNTLRSSMEQNSPSMRTSLDKEQRKERKREREKERERECVCVSVLTNNVFCLFFYF